MSSLLALRPGIDVVGVSGDGRAAVDMALALLPDVVLMDIRMPVMDGVAATAEIKSRLPDTLVLMLTTFDDEASIVDALRAGASGYLLKDMPDDELADAIRLARSGLLPLNPAVAARLVKAASRAPDRNISAPEPASTEPLTPRERDVLRLIATGATNREIAAQLFVSEGTIKNHISNLLSRLGLRDRTQAAVYARDHGLG
ncbi:MAG TPA: response regulator transcription factor [Anaerolineales bacterium]|nr:response regulator transcription factor [Anaerolineales bacterium]